VIKLPFDFEGTLEIFLAILFSVITFFLVSNPFGWGKNLARCTTYNIFYDHRLLSVSSFWVQIPISGASKEVAEASNT
jgi:hypothetical protein